MTRGEWATFTFYHGTLTGHRYVVDGQALYEVVPTNGRAGWWDVISVRGEREWVGESFTSVEDAKAWVEPPLTEAERVYLARLALPDDVHRM